MSESSAAAPTLWLHPEFRRGAREMAGVALGISAWGMVAGVAMANSSLGTAWAVVMSLVVFSGTGQIASLPLLGSGAPPWVVWATVLCVNLRFVIFSLQWRPLRLPPLRSRWRISHPERDTSCGFQAETGSRAVAVPGAAWPSTGARGRCLHCSASRSRTNCRCNGA
jgi:predicted branched-subunit amino acid permease